MVVAITLAIIAGILGWQRAAKRGGNRADKIQYALAHAIPAFLIGMIAMTIAAGTGMLG